MKLKGAYLIPYLAEGFSLTNKTLDLFLLSFLLYVPILIPKTFFPGIPTILVTVVRFLIFALHMAFVLSLPIFLVKRQKNKKITANEVAHTLIKNTWAIIAPLIFALIVLILIFVVMVIWITITFHPAKNEIANFIKSPTGAPLIGVIVTIVFSLFRFAGSYFSLESENFITSFKKSVRTSVKNPRFTLIVICLGILAYLLGFLTPSEVLWIKILKLLASSYVAWILDVSALLYYQRVVKKSK
jgi:NADH:ubiquinone oxidoreductase subunit 5 (subunit L)/multisubunit Na+/H+ antiporter MnhA subunit